MALFRLATAADLPAIVGTYNATVASRMVTADLEPVTVESRRDWFNAHAPHSRPIWVIEEDGVYAGWVSVSSFYGRAAYDGTAEVSVYVETAFQRRGIGKAALTKVLAEAPSLGLHTLLGFVFAHNPGSVKLFTSQGYAQWALLPGVAVLDGVSADLMIVGRKTGHSALSGPPAF